MVKKLRRSNTDRVFLGVAGGLGQYFEVDPVLVRVVFVILAFFSGGLVILLYLLIALLIPQEGSAAQGSTEAIKENLRSLEQEVSQAGQRVRSAVTGDQGTKSDQGNEADQAEAEARRTRNNMAIVLIAIGLVILLINVGLFRWFDWGRFWPIVLIVIGGAILLTQLRRR
jgi:phage shock protein PspC (stress-responsive transcriptional regulator)